MSKNVVVPCANCEDAFRALAQRIKYLVHDVRLWSRRAGRAEAELAAANPPAPAKEE